MSESGRVCGSEPSSSNVVDDDYCESDNGFDSENEDLTLDEEEALDDEDGANELAALEEEQDLPIEELMLRYGYGGQNQNEHVHTPGDDDDSLPDDIPTSSTANNGLICVNRTCSDDEDEPGSTHLLLNNVVDYEYDDDDDCDYQPKEAATIRVGDDFQADLPQYVEKAVSSTSGMGDSGERVWDPTLFDETQVEDYLTRVNATTSKYESGSNESVPDSERALQTLYKLKNVDSAVQRQKIKTDNVTVKPWTETETQLFEEGLALYGKQFSVIQHIKIPDRSVGELVHFYYHWKQTERRALFHERVQFERKQYLSYPHMQCVMQTHHTKIDVNDGQIGIASCSSSNKQPVYDDQKLPPPSSSFTFSLQPDQQAVTPQLLPTFYHNGNNPADPGDAVAVIGGGFELDLPALLEEEPDSTTMTTVSDDLVRKYLPNPNEVQQSLPAATSPSSSSSSGCRKRLLPLDDLNILPSSASEGNSTNGNQVSTAAARDCDVIIPNKVQKLDHM